MQLKNALIATLLFVASVFCLGVQPVRALTPDDAVAYRTNPAHTGQNTMPEMGLPLTKAWNVKLTGTIESYPLIAGGDVFVLVSGTGSQISLYALNGSTGAIVWGPVALPSGVDSVYGAAMAYENGVIFVTQNQTNAEGGMMVAYDASTGTLDWTTTYSGAWWNNDIPTALGGNVYTQEEGVVYSIAETNGGVNWSTPQETGAIAGGLAVTSGGGLFLSGSCGDAYSLSQTNGSTTWSALTGCESDTGFTPAYYSGDLFIQNYFTNGAVAPYPSAELNATSGSLVQTFPGWTPNASANFDAPDVQYPAFDNGTLFEVLNNDVTAITLDNGVTAWTTNDSTNVPITAPIVVNGDVYVATSTGLLEGYDETTGDNVVSLPLNVTPQSSQTFGSIQAGDGMILIPFGTELIAVASSPATHFSVTSNPTTVAGNTLAVTVTALDANNNVATGYSGTVHFTSSDGKAILPANGGLSAGSSVFNVTLETAGSQTITATDTQTPSITGTSSPVTVTPAQAKTLSIIYPTTATAGQAFDITVKALDLYGNVATGYTGTVHFTSTDGQAVLPANSLLTNGSATFAVTLKTAGSQTITAQDTVTSTITFTTGNITVSPGPTSHFVFSTPVSTTAGAVMSVTVTATDNFGNTVTGYGGTVGFTSTDPKAVLPAASKLTNGVGTLNFTLETAGIQTLTATDTTTSSVTGTSNPIDVNPAAVTQFEFVTPATANAGTSFSFTINACDQFGNLNPTYNGKVQLSSSDAAAIFTSVQVVLSNGTANSTVALITAGSQTISAQDIVTTSIKGTSNAIIVNPGSATHLFVSAPTTATVAQAITFTVQALDQFNNVATSYSGTVHFTSTDAAASLPADSTLATGVGTFKATFATPGNQTITATDTSTPSITGTSGLIAVQPGPAASFKITAPSTATAGVQFDITITALDQFGNVATGYTGTVDFSSSDSAAVLPAPSTLTDGTRTLAVTLKTSGSQTITGTDSATSSLTGTSSPITVNPAAATHFTLTTPATAQSGKAFSFGVTALDQFGNVATGYTGTVHFTSTDAAASLPADFTFTDGTATFNATLNTDGNQTITATDTVTSSITGTSPAISVSGAATHFQVVATTPVTAGTVDSFTVTALDASGNVAVSYTGTVGFTSTDPNATLPANSTLANGVGAFNATLKTAGTQTITAKDTLTQSIGGTSNAITVNAAAAAAFKITAPTPVIAGTAFNVTVTSVDQFGNVATGYTGTFKFTSSDTKAVLPGESGLHNGTGTFSVALGTAGAQTITVTDIVTSTITGTSNSITVDPGAASYFTVSAPATATAGSAISVSVTAFDRFNNLDTTYSGTVHFTSTDPQAVLPADTKLTNGAGSFSVTLKTDGTQTITATDTLTTSVTGTSGDISVVPGPATHLSVTAPATASAGTAFSITVTALDQFGNVATGYTGTVGFTSTDPNALLPASSTLSSGSGTFSVTLQTAGNQTITATDTVTTSIKGASNTIAVSAGPVTHFGVVAPATATAGDPIDFTVTALDAFGNVNTSYAGTVAFTSSDTAATLPGNSTLTNGVKTFSATLKTGGPQTITATDTVTSSITGMSNTIAVDAGPASHFTVTAPTTATAGTSFNFTVTALDSFGNTVTGYSGTVHFSSTDAKATLPADSQLTEGTGTFSATLKTPGSQKIVATDTANVTITGTSNAIVVSPGAATQLSVSAPSTAVAGTPINVTVTALDQFGNVATGYTGTVHFTSTDTAAVLPSDSTLTSGTGTFSVTLETAGSQTITAADKTTASINGTSGAIVVSPGAPTALSVSAPSTATFGKAVNFTVTAVDAEGNTVTSYAGTVDFSSSDTKAVLPAASKLSNGTGTFSVTFKTIGSETLTATDSTTASLKGTATVTVSAAVLDTFQQGLAMISAPSDYSGLPLSEYLTPTPSLLATWVPSTFQYAIYPNSPADAMRPGLGYWANFTALTSLLDIGVDTNPATTIQVPLAVGWNMIGDPFTTAVTLNGDVQVKTASSTIPYSEAANGTIISPTLYTYQAGDTNYEPEETTLQPYEGYWIYAISSCTLEISSN